MYIFVIYFLNFFCFHTKIQFSISLETLSSGIGLRGKINIGLKILKIGFKTYDFKKFTSLKRY